MTAHRALIIALCAFLGIAFILWIADGLPREQSRMEHEQFEQCTSAHVRDGDDRHGAELQCAYITDMERLGK